jgi:hypothetical protein
VFGDFVSGRLFRLAPGAAAHEFMLASGRSIASFGEATDGELYVLDYSGGIYRIVAGP